jgi:hypothetical protein
MTRQRQRYRQRLRHTYGRQSINRASILLSLRPWGGCRSLRHIGE